MPRDPCPAESGCACASTRPQGGPRTSAPPLEQRRGEVLRGLFPLLSSWMETAVERARRRDVEDYLSQATDVFDLEERIRRLDRRASGSMFS